MNENTNETYAAQTQRASFVGSLDVVDRLVVDLGETRLMLEPTTAGATMPPCQGRAKICTESPGTPKPSDWIQGTAAAKRQPSSLFH